MLGLTIATPTGDTTKKPGKNQIFHDKTDAPLQWRVMIDDNSRSPIWWHAHAISPPPLLFLVFAVNSFGTICYQTTCYVTFIHLAFRPQ